MKCYFNAAGVLFMDFCQTDLRILFLPFSRDDRSIVGEPEPVHILLQVVYQRIRQRKAIIFESSFYIK